MEQEKNLLNFTQEELFRYIQMQRRIYALEEYQLMKTDLLNKVKRVLDFRDLIKITESNCKKTRKIINKYAKQCKKELNFTSTLKYFNIIKNQIDSQLREVYPVFAIEITIYYAIAGVITRQSSIKASAFENGTQSWLSFLKPFCSNIYVLTLSESKT